MKKSKGFILVGELFCLTLASLLLVTAVEGYSMAFKSLAHACSMQDAWQAAALAVAGEQVPERWQVVRKEVGLSAAVATGTLEEVEIYDAGTGKIICNLLQVKF